jgi:hypothetical protein
MKRTVSRHDLLAARKPGLSGAEHQQGTTHGI